MSVDRMGLQMIAITTLVQQFAGHRRWHPIPVPPPTHSHTHTHKALGHRGGVVPFRTAAAARGGRMVLVWCDWVWAGCGWVSAAAAFKEIGCNTLLPQNVHRDVSQTQHQTTAV